MKTRYLACVGLWACGALGGLAAENSGMAGRWTLDPARGSSIKPWTSETLAITVQGDAVRIDRNLAWEPDRRVSDSTTLQADGRTITANAVPYWFDSWYNNAFIGTDHLKRVRGEWIESGRVLKVETALFLEAQQGDVPVHIYDEYHLSADGRTLRLLELRSTRDQALTYVFTRE
jgi:hypothetical protein